MRSMHQSWLISIIIKHCELVSVTKADKVIRSHPQVSKRNDGLTWSLITALTLAIISWILSILFNFLKCFLTISSIRFLFGMRALELVTWVLKPSYNLYSTRVSRAYVCSWFSTLSNWFFIFSEKIKKEILQCFDSKYVKSEL